MGKRDIRRLIIIGAMVVVRWAARRGAPAGSWLARMLERKPRMVVAVALAAKMARSALGHARETGRLQESGGDSLNRTVAIGASAV